MTDATPVGHWVSDDCDVYVGRGGGDLSCTMLTTDSPDEYGAFGNPFTLDQFERLVSIDHFEALLDVRVQNSDEWREAVADLHGQTLGCWCRSVTEDAPACHGDILAAKADELAGENDD